MLKLLQDLRNFWRTLHIPLINCEVSLTLTWSKNCVFRSQVKREAVDGGNSIARINNPEEATFKITGTKLYVPVVTLSTQDDNKL